MIKNLMTKLNNKPEGGSGESVDNSAAPAVPVAPAVTEEVQVEVTPVAPAVPEVHDAISSPVPTVPAAPVVPAVPVVPAAPVPPIPDDSGMSTPVVPQVPAVPQNITDNYQPVAVPSAPAMVGGNNMQNQFSRERGPVGDGIVIDLGEGISLNVPIRKRMTITEFLKVAEKVKALEMLSEEGYN